MQENYQNTLEMSKAVFVKKEIARLQNQLKSDLTKPWGKDAEMLPEEMLQQMAADTWEIDMS